jgi:hypothetical protein
VVSAADVPGRYDLVLTFGGNSYGFCFLDSVEPSIPLRTHRSVYTLSPTFIDRQNVSGNYGDNQQDFWMTATQNDWGGGEDQHYFRPNDQDSRRRYWRGANVTVDQAGGIGIGYDKLFPTFPTDVNSACSSIDGTAFLVATNTNLYSLSTTGTITDKGAHGLGRAPAMYGMVTDGRNLFLSSTGPGTVGVRMWDGTTFSTFSATPADALAFLNNGLYGYRSINADLVRWDTTGTMSTLYPWEGADGSAAGGVARDVKLCPFGGKLAILRRPNSEVFLYDGNGVSTIWKLDHPLDDIALMEGLLCVGGKDASNRQVVDYYENGSFGNLWTSPDTYAGAGETRLCQFGQHGDTGLAWPDHANAQYVHFNLARGGVIRLAAITASFSDSDSIMVSNRTQFFMTRQTGTASDLYPDSSGALGTAQVFTSLFDFDSSLTKLFRGIKISWTAASDGNGGSADVYYRLNDLAGSYTLLKGGATNGVEYALPDATIGSSLSLRVDLLKSTSTLGPVLDRTYVRAAPDLQSFKRGQYLIDCTATTKLPRRLRDGTHHPKSGREQADALMLASQQTAPLTVTDRFGAFTGLFDLGREEGFALFEVHPALDEPAKSGAFIARVWARQV